MVGAATLWAVTGDAVLWLTLTGTLELERVTGSDFMLQTRVTVSHC